MYIWMLRRGGVSYVLYYSNTLVGFISIETVPCTNSYDNTSKYIDKIFFLYGTGSREFIPYGRPV
jgi:hypothetical protein